MVITIEQNRMRPSTPATITDVTWPSSFVQSSLSKPQCGASRGIDPLGQSIRKILLNLYSWMNLFNQSVTRMPARYKRKLFHWAKMKWKEKCAPTHLLEMHSCCFPGERSRRWSCGDRTRSLRSRKKLPWKPIPRSFPLNRRMHRFL